jgi:hypothetical protein
MKFTGESKSTGKRWEITAGDYDEAAQCLIRSVVRRDAIAVRVTGDPGLSGIWQGYVSYAGAQHAIGPNFSIW